MVAKIVRGIFILIGLALMITEMYLSAVGAFKVNTAVYYAIPMAFVAVMMIAGEAISLHYAHAYKLRRQYSNVTIAVCLWALAFIVGTFFTVAGVNVRTEQNTATRVAGFLKFDTQERTEKELTRDIGLLTDQVAALQAATINDGGTQRKLRPVAAIEADGRFLKSDRCGNVNPTNTGQRTVCQEYASARDLAQKEGELKEKRQKLDAARDKLTSGDVVLSRNGNEAAIFANMGMSPDAAMVTVSIFIGLTLHVFSSLIWFVVPKIGEHDLAPEIVHPAHQSTTHVVRFEHAPIAPAPAPLSLSAPGVSRDPAKLAMLVGKFWEETLQTLDKGQVYALESPAFVAKFENFCAQNSIEMPPSSKFHTLSEAHVPNLTSAGGKYWFKP